MPVTVTHTGTLRGRGRIVVTGIDTEVTGSGSGAGWQCHTPPSNLFLSCAHDFSIDPGQSLPVLSVSLQPSEQAYPATSVLFTVVGSDAYRTYVGQSISVTGIADLSASGGLQFTSQPATVGNVEPVTLTVTNVGAVASTGGIRAYFEAGANSRTRSSRRRGTDGPARRSPRGSSAPTSAQ